MPFRMPESASWRPKTRAPNQRRRGPPPSTLVRFRASRLMRSLASRMSSSTQHSSGTSTLPMPPTQRLPAPRSMPCIESPTPTWYCIVSWALPGLPVPSGSLRCSWTRQRELPSRLTRSQPASIARSALDVTDGSNQSCPPGRRLGSTPTPRCTQALNRSVRPWRSSYSGAPTTSTPTSLTPAGCGASPCASRTSSPIITPTWPSPIWQPGKRNTPLRSRPTRKGTWSFTRPSRCWERGSTPRPQALPTSYFQSLTSQVGSLLNFQLSGPCSTPASPSSSRCSAEMDSGMITCSAAASMRPRQGMQSQSQRPYPPQPRGILKSSNSHPPTSGAPIVSPQRPGLPAHPRSRVRSLTSRSYRRVTFQLPFQPGLCASMASQENGMWVFADEDVEESASAAKLSMHRDS
nr:ORF3 [Bat Middle East Hepe-Astrovirus]